ncbi:hypothetical protein [Bifidobacterium sp. ESL0704]|uniref:hypothetical protein n=1 Tax=Bifidobacterium sp. ESL0704 TaxID=2983219 RepID=UPI0023F84F20|nr:hypothetical protein [Bifidobacterium sp. ESL0704]WEV53587.1 hypothetical protein OZX64_03745 [Bifidobacterium sp. ESL0704]
MTGNGKDQSTGGQLTPIIDRDVSKRGFPKYSALIFSLGFVFQIPDSAYVGHQLLMWLQPTLIVLLYIAMLKVPRLAWQRVAALALISMCI